LVGSDRANSGEQQGESCHFEKPAHDLNSFALP
jgi:hypothetical protein